MSNFTPTNAWMVFCNATLSLVWGRVAVIMLTMGWEELANEESSSCLETLGSATRLALGISFVEVFNCVVGFTRTPIPAALLFSCTRAGVELLVGPMIPCASWQHLLTVGMWAIGDFVRFGCFAADTAFPGTRTAKSIRFTVGPVLFPIGASGEMFMVILAASTNNKPGMYVAAALWPVFFYPMMKQLLKQRRKHFQPPSKPKEIKAI